MAQLSHTTNIACHDDFYAQLVALHEGLSEKQSMIVNAKLILVLANHIGDPEVLSQALQLAGMVQKRQRL